VHSVLLHSGLLDVYEAKADADPTARERIENLKALVQRAVLFDETHPDSTLMDFLADIALVTDIDGWDPSVQSLSLMTLHCAKGLEFDFVFIAGVEDGLLPHWNSDTFEQTEEERRLFYVGLTRARREVAIALAAQRHTWRSSGIQRPSIFLSELPEDTVEAEDLTW
jgi:DNA helicase-2/ATP-dependent DNA helicase PcrA